MEASTGRNNVAAKFWRQLPASNASDHDWYAFLQGSAAQIAALVHQIDHECEGDPYRRLEEIRRLRREHHLLVVADRIRREAQNGRDLRAEDLRRASEKIVDYSARVVAADGRSVEPRSPLEERMLNSARVHWHKLIQRAGLRSELRGGRGDKSKVRGTSVITAKIARQRPLRRSQLLREHIRDRLEQLAGITTDISALPDSRLTREDRLLIRELELLLQRARTAAEQDPDATTAPHEPRRRRRLSLAERQSDASRYFAGTDDPAPQSLSRSVIQAGDSRSDANLSSDDAAGIQQEP